MLQSMTGFGKAEGQLENCKINVQLRSLNSKQADINVKVPSIFKEREIQMRTLLSNKLERGKIELYVSLEESPGEISNEINEELFKHYYHQLKNIANQLGQNEQYLLSTIAGFPDIFTTREQNLNDEDWDKYFGVLELAIDDLVSFRKEEGNNLHKELDQRRKNILALLDEVKTFEKERVETVKERISKNLEELKAEANGERLEQEMIYYLEKYDITEEKVRLKMHLDYFQETMAEDFPQGKKLGFISQEIGREINTLGAKANHAKIQKIVVQMKDELEKIKEQILNIL